MPAVPAVTAGPVTAGPVLPVPPVPPHAVPWSTFAAQAPELAAVVRDRLLATAHHVLATLTATGAPRVSGTEVAWVGDRLAIGSMPGSRKSADLRRDARFALHSNPGDGSMRAGDAKLQGRAAVMTTAEVAALLGARPADGEGPGEADGFWLDLTAVALTTVDGDVLRVTAWRPGRPVTVVER